jgi:hypothetical protein
VNSQAFETLALTEMHRRGVENARAVAAVMDGAEWLQTFTDYHCPQAVRTGWEISWLERAMRNK